MLNNAQQPRFENPSENSVAQTEIVRIAFQQVLDVEALNNSESFFELGGQSLQVVRVISLIRAACGKEVSFSAFFENPTVSGVSAALETAPEGRKALKPRNS